MNLAVCTSKSPLIIDLLHICILYPVEVVICSSPSYHDGVGAIVIANIALDLGGCILHHCELGEMWVCLAKSTGPALDLLVSTV